MYQTKYEDPFAETNCRVQEYLRRNGGGSMHMAYEAVLKADPELNECHKSAMQKLIKKKERGTVACQDPQKEAAHKAREYARDHGLDSKDPEQLKAAYKRIFSADPKLYERCEHQVKGHRIEECEPDEVAWTNDPGRQVQGAAKEALYKARELMKEYRGTGLIDTLSDGLKTVFNNDPQLYQRYEMETKGRR